MSSVSSSTSSGNNNIALESPTNSPYPTVPLQQMFFDPGPSGEGPLKGVPSTTIIIPREVSDLPRARNYYQLSEQPFPRGTDKNIKVQGEREDKKQTSSKRTVRSSSVTGHDRATKIPRVETTEQRWKKLENEKLPRNRVISKHKQEREDEQTNQGTEEKEFKQTLEEALAKRTSGPPPLKKKQEIKRAQESDTREEANDSKTERGKKKSAKVQITSSSPPNYSPPPPPAERQNHKIESLEQAPPPPSYVPHSPDRGKSKKISKNSQSKRKRSIEGKEVKDKCPPPLTPRYGEMKKNLFENLATQGVTEQNFRDLGILRPDPLQRAPRGLHVPLAGRDNSDRIYFSAKDKNWTLPCLGNMVKIVPGVERGCCGPTAKEKKLYKLIQEASQIAQEIKTNPDLCGDTHLEQLAALSWKLLDWLNHYSKEKATPDYKHITELLLSVEELHKVLMTALQHYPRQEEEAPPTYTHIFRALAAKQNPDLFKLYLAKHRPGIFLESEFKKYKKSSDLRKLTYEQICKITRKLPPKSNFSAFFVWASVFSSNALEKPARGKEENGDVGNLYDVNLNDD